MTLLGYARKEEVIGTRILEYIHPDYVEDWLRLQTQLWQVHIPSFSLETCLLMRDGTAVLVNVTAILFEDDGELLGYTILEDITARKQAEQQAQQMARQLAAANQEIQSTNEALRLANEGLSRSNVDLDTFVYTASHDLKSPVVSLDALVGFLSKRLEGKLDGKEQEILALIQSSSKRLQQAIRDLTQIASVQRDVKQAPVTIHFPELLEEVQADLAGQLEASGARLLTDFGVGSLPYSRKNLRSILLNLLSNALKYRSPERTCHIRVASLLQEGKVTLTVSDNGLGLTEKQQQGLFGMFKRFHTQVEGSGVGLYTIKRLIENEGGRITVDSQPGRGTTFQVLF